MKARTYMFENLNCPHCAAKIEKAVSGLEGVQEARVSFGTGSMNVKFDETVLDEQKVKDTVRKFNVGIATVLPGPTK